MVVPKQHDGSEGMVEPLRSSNALDEVKGVADAAGKTVVAAALAGAVASGAAAVTPDKIHLPDPAPIVQTADQGVDLPDSSVDDQAQKKTSAWKSIFKILKYALLALLFVAGIVFGIMKGCASCTGQLAAPPADSSASSSAAQEAAGSEAA